MKTRVLAGLALLASLSPVANAQYISSGPYVAAEPAYGYHQSKEDCPPRAWITSEYLRWYLKDSPLNVPLVTANTTGARATPGEVGTFTLFGGQDQSYDALNGLRIGGGLRLDSDGCYALESSFFLLERGGENFNVASDAAGNPSLARPIVQPNGAPFGLAISIPGFFAGGVNASTSSELFGSELNLSSVIYSNNASRLSLLAGFRYLRLEEQITVTQSTTDLAAGAILFQQTVLPDGSSFGATDSFETRNNIYAPQLGARYTWDSGIWSLGLVGKVGLGWNNKRVAINGSTTATPLGGITTSAPGGILAQASNIGTYNETDFVVVPEVGATLGVNLFPWLRVTGGYNFLYVNKVARPGNQIDPVVDFSQSSLSAGQAGATRPAFLMRDSDFWVHGWTAGLQLRW